MSSNASTGAQGQSFGKIFPMYFLHDDERLGRGLPDIHQAIDNMRSYSTVGAKLLHWAQERKVGFQLTDDLPLHTVAVCARNNAGTMEQPRHANLRFNRQYKIYDDFSLERIIAHELMHAIQHVEHNLLARDIEYGLQDYMLSSLCSEAAAETMAALVCFEMAGRGFSAPFEKMLDAGRVDRHYHTHHRKFGQVYNDLMQNPGQDAISAQDAIASACGEAFHSYMNNPSMVQTYAAACMEKYINGIASGLFDGKPAKKRMLTNDGAADYARITGNFTLIDRVDLPQSYKKIFGGNKRMRQFAEALDFHRDCRCYSEEEMNPARVILEQDDNPYLDMDLKEFWKEAEPKIDFLEEQSKGARQSREVAIVRMASAYAQLDEVFQLHLPFDKDDAHAPNHEAQARIYARSMPRALY